MTGYSQAPRGLSVPSSVPCICTGPAISPGRSLRQCPSRYAFRAGRNLPDKEFRYLRTVIVTAAVDWGFGSALAPLPFTVQHWAGVSPYTASYDFAGTCVCGKQSLGPLCCARRVAPTGPLLPKIRGQFAEFLNERSPARLRLLASPTCGGLGTETTELPGRLFWARVRLRLAGASPRRLPPRSCNRDDVPPTGRACRPKRPRPLHHPAAVAESLPRPRRLRPRASP